MVPFGSRSRGLRLSCSRMLFSVHNAFALAVSLGERVAIKEVILPISSTKGIDTTYFIFRDYSLRVRQSQQLIRQYTNNQNGRCGVGKLGAPALWRSRPPAGFRLRICLGLLV